MTPMLLLAALLSVADPQGDAIGQGNLTPPTAVVFRAPGIFDAQQITVPEADTFGFELTMGQLPNPWRLANGFSFPIIEVYLSTKSGGQNTLLPGSNMRLPEGQGWHYAFRLTGDRFDVYRATEQGMPVQVTDMIGAQLEVIDNTLHVRTNLPLPERYSIFGMVGSYDPFTANGWRAVTDTPNPWAFSSREPSVPVIDVIADSFSMQRAALARGVLPEIRSAVRQDAWLIVAAVGFAFMVVAAFGQLLLPKRPTKRTLAAANQAIKAPNQVASNAPTKPKTAKTAKRTAHKAARAKPPSGRHSRGTPSNNVARGLARQQQARASQTPHPNQPMLLGDKLVFASDADPISMSDSEATMTEESVVEVPMVEAATDKTSTDILANECVAGETSANEPPTSLAPKAQPTTTKTLRPPPDNALMPRSAPRATTPTLETTFASTAEPIIDAPPELTTEVLDVNASQQTADTGTADTEISDVKARSASSEQAVSALSPRQDTFAKDVPKASAPSSSVSSQETTEQTPPQQPTVLSERRAVPASRSSANRLTPTNAPKTDVPDTADADTTDADISDTDSVEENLLPAERIRRERLARQSQGWEDDFFDDGWFDWQTSQAVFEDEDA